MNLNHSFSLDPAQLAMLTTTDSEPELLQAELSLLPDDIIVVERPLKPNIIEGYSHGGINE